MVWSQLSDSLSIPSWTSTAGSYRSSAGKAQTTRHGINPANLNSLPEVPVATQTDLDQAAAAG